MSADEAGIYEDHILRHYEEPYHNESFADATHRQRVDNPVCGDSVELQLGVRESRIVSQAWYTGSGCVISQASASMLVEYIEGKSLKQLSQLYCGRHVEPLPRAPDAPSATMLSTCMASLAETDRADCLTLTPHALAAFSKPCSDRSCRSIAFSPTSLRKSRISCSFRIPESKSSAAANWPVNVDRFSITHTPKPSRDARAHSLRDTKAIKWMSRWLNSAARGCEPLVCKWSTT